jgi:hypothetical protein
MMLPLPAMVIGAHLAFAIADTVPRLNVEPSCRMSAAGAGGIPQQTVDACRKDEQDAHDQLVREWASFAPRDRATCVDLSKAGGDTTYTEVLTCLEMMRDARQIPADSKNPPTTTGQRAR